MITAQVINGGLPSIVYCTQAGINGTSSSFVFAAQPISNPKPRRFVVVGIMVTSSLAISTVTIGGVTATPIVHHGTSGISYLWGALVPTGTIANIVVTFTGSTTVVMGIGVWAVYSIRSLFPFAVVESSSSPANLSLNVPAHGVVIAMAGNEFIGGTYTWTGATADFSVLKALTVMGRSGSGFLVPSGASPYVPLSVAYSSSDAINRRAFAVSLR